MQAKKLFNTAIALSIAAFCLAGCGSNTPPVPAAGSPSASNNGSDSSAASGQLAPYALTIIAAGDEPADQGKVNAAVEAQVKDTMNITLNVQYTNWTDYQTTLQTQAASGAPFDIFINFQNGIGPYYTNGQAIKLNDLLDQYGPDIKKNISAANLAMGVLNGDQIAIPAVYLTDDTYAYMLYRKDLVPDAAPITDLASMEAYLAAAHAADPTISPVETGVGTCVQRAINLNYPLTKVLLYGADQMSLLAWTESGADAFKVQDYAEMPNYKDAVAWGQKAMSAGWLAPDGNIGTNPGQLFEAGKAALMNIDPYNFTAIITATTQAIPSADIGWAILNPDQPLDVGQSNNFAQISTTSKDPARAMMFLNWIQASQANYDLWYWGIEGTDYTLDSNGIVQLPSGVAGGGTTGVNNPYAPCVWYFKNSLWDRAVNTDAQQTIDAEKSNMSAKRFPALQTINFIFDPTNVKTQMDDCDKVAAQYFNPLMGGQLSADKYDEYISKLKSSGIQDCIDECQKQLEAYMTANNITAPVS